MMDYKRLGYSGNWIIQRLKSIEIRKDLTDQWKITSVPKKTDSQYTKAKKYELFRKRADINPVIGHCNYNNYNNYSEKWTPS